MESLIWHLEVAIVLQLPQLLQLQHLQLLQAQPLGYVPLLRQTKVEDFVRLLGQFEVEWWPIIARIIVQIIDLEPFFAWSLGNLDLPWEYEFVIELQDLFPYLISQVVQARQLPYQHHHLHLHIHHLVIPELQHLLRPFSGYEGPKAKQSLEFNLVLM